MPRKNRDKPFVTYQVYDATTKEPIKLSDDKPLRVSGYTLKAARHSAKRACDVAFTLEPSA